MDRLKNLLHGVEQELSSAQKTYDGNKRDDLKDSDFLFPETRSFPIVSPADVKDAISNYGRMSGKMTYDAFLRKLYNMCKNKGPSFVAALPQASKEKLGIKTESADETSNIEDDSMLEDDAEYLNMVCNALRNINSNITAILNNVNLDHVKENLTEPWVLGMIAVIEDNISNVHDFVKFNDNEDDNEETEAVRKEINRHHKPHHKPKSVTNIPYRLIPGFLMRVEPSHNEQNEHELHEGTNETEEPTTETNETSTDTPSTMASPDRPGLWENIRKKKEREGKNYKPAKRGDKDRPDPEAWKNLTKEEKKK
jgi:hypothetical protein